jgi:hypothetical protein
MSDLLKRWLRQEESALEQMASGTTVKERAYAYARSDLLESKWLATAVAPICVLVGVDQLGWGHNTIWWAGIWLSVVWAIMIVTPMFVAMFRALSHSLRRKG